MRQRKNETREEFLKRRREFDRRPESLLKAKEWRKNNPESVRAIQRRHYLKRPGILGKLKYEYGLTIEQYDAMIAAHGGLCAACGSPPRKGRPLCVDHCHKTRIIRGLLCDACNVCAGYLESERRAMVERYLVGNQVGKFTQVTAA